MKIWSFFLPLLILSIYCFAQKPKIQWGEEFKLRKGSTDLQVMYADKSGVYLQEGHMAIKTYFVIGASARSSATLVKLDKSLYEIYRSNFNKELKGKEFEQFFVLQDKLFLFASQYDKGKRARNIFAAEINKNSGELAGNWKLVTTFLQNEKKDIINYKITLNSDSTKMVFVSSVEGNDKIEFQVQEFDHETESSGKSAVITNEFDPKTFKLEDLIYTNNKKIILVARMYEYQEGKNKKSKFLDFVKYNIRLYNEQGEQQAEINTTINDKWLSSTKLVQEKGNDLVLAAFYSNEKKSKTIDGLLVQRIDPVSGRVKSTTQKEISNLSLSDDTNADDDSGDEDETKEEKRERENLKKIKDEGEGFSKYMRFRNIFYTSDNGLVILAEKYHYYTHTSTSYVNGVNGGAGSWKYTTYEVDDCGDLMMCKIDAVGEISWLNVLPKAQREVYTSSSNSGSGVSLTFFDTFNRPFYAGFGAMQNRNTIQVIFNDNPKNAVVTQPGQKVKYAQRFSNTDCYILTIDEITGKRDRKFFYSNRDVPTSMPRLGRIIGREMYIIGKNDRLFGKTRIAVAKITM